MDLGYNAKLPASFRDITLRYPDATGLQTVAERITETTRIPVELHPDVLRMVASGAAASTGVVGVGAAATAGPSSSQPQMRIPMDFRGNLADFLDLLCARQGLGWQYNNGTISISRYVTRIFQLAATPGTVRYATTVSKGSNASTGSSGSASAQATGAFASTSETGLTADKLSAIDSIKTAITAMLTPNQGKVTVSDATGTVVVTDTRMVVDQVSRLIAYENDLMTRQVSVQVDIITLQVDDTTELGLDANVIYKALSGRWGLSLGAAGTLITAAAGNMTYGVTSGSLNTSNIVLKALDGYGQIVQKTSTTLITTNRTPMPVAQFATRGYLASTMPAGGGGTAAGTGVPGLTPGSVTTGLFVSALPTILDNNSLLLRLSVDSSALQSIDSTSTGSGSTFQQIQYPNVTGYKSDHHVTMRSGDALVLVGLNTDGINGQVKTAILSGSMRNTRNQNIQVIVVTPRIQSGV
jgi:type IVB pilus formation R64 PilN family outer membrane protein